MRNTRSIIRKHKAYRQHRVAGLKTASVEGRRHDEVRREDEVSEATRRSGGRYMGGAVVAAMMAPLSLTPAAIADIQTEAITPITEAEVELAQQKWAAGIVGISTAFLAAEDYRGWAELMLQDLYAFEELDVLFKPTLAADQQFRPDMDDALSYFVGGKHEEDTGFAIKPWQSVRFGEQQIITLGTSALAMGNYFFTPAGETEEVKAEFSFGYVKDETGELKIVLHHSSLPFQPA